MGRWAVWAVWGGVLLGGGAEAGDLGWHLIRDLPGVTFGGYVEEMDAIKVLYQDEGRDVRIVYGDRLGLIHVLKYENRRFREVWVSPSMRGPVAQVFVDDVDGEGQAEIVAYTEVGQIVVYRANDYRQVWRSTDDEFETISAMTLANVDSDPQLEMVFCAEAKNDVAGYRPSRSSGGQADLERERANQIGRLFVYDGLNLFVEWSTVQGLTAESICVADLDNDGVPDIALNTGFVVDSGFQRVKWHWPDGFGQRVGFADLDGDGIPELVGEYQTASRPRQTIRVFDVDLQAENFLSKGR